MAASNDNQIRIKIPAAAGTDPVMEQLAKDSLHGLRWSSRYLRMSQRDPEFCRALYLANTVLYFALHPDRSVDEIMAERPERQLYLQYVLGASRHVMSVCDQPEERAERLLAGAFFVHFAGVRAQDARSVAREALAFEHTPGLEAAFAAGHAAARRWLADDRSEPWDLFRLDAILDGPMH